MHVTKRFLNIMLILKCSPHLRTRSTPRPRKKMAYHKKKLRNKPEKLFWILENTISNRILILFSVVNLLAMTTCKAVKMEGISQSSYDFTLKEFITFKATFTKSVKVVFGTIIQPILVVKSFFTQLIPTL